MSETWCPFAVRYEITTQEFTKVRAYPCVSIADHISAGSDSRGWLRDADNGSSVHFLIRVENGKAVIYQFMPIEWAAWGNGRFSRNNPYNPKWIRDFLATCPDTDAGRAKASRFLLASTVSIEHEGVTPTAALYTGPMLEADIRLHKWLKQQIPTIVVDREHIIGHYQIDHINRAFCPGGLGGALYPFDTIIRSMKGAELAEIYFPETGHKVMGEIGSYFVQTGAISEHGYPITDEYQMKLEDGLTYTVQLFQKSLIQYRADKGAARANLGVYYGQAAGVI